MSRTLAAGLCLCLGMGMLQPALADDDDALDKVVDGSLMVTRVGGAAAGVVIGVPVAAIRQTVKHYKKMTPALADKVGGSDFGPSSGLVSIVTLPASMVMGAACGTYYGTKNGVKEGFNAPFSAASFSMDEDIED